MTDPATRDTVAMYFVQSAVARLAPAARERALRSAGLAQAPVQRDAARVPASAFSALWLAVAREMDDEFFGLDCRGMKVGSFALICQAVLGCENLDRALQRMLRCFALFLDELDADLLLEADSAVLRLHNRIAAPADRRFADETFLTLVHGLMCWLVGQRVAVREVCFAHPRPAHAAEYTVMFSQHLVFDAEFTCLRFDAKALSAPVTRSAVALQQFLRTAPQSVFLRYKNEDSWTARVRRHLRSHLAHGDWPVFEAVAAAWRVAPTTLRRRLEEEGTSFQGIKDQLRSDLAVHRLCHSDQSVEAIGAELGFADASAFHRAFKRWNGMQPGEYRLRGRRPEGA